VKGLVAQPFSPAVGRGVPGLFNTQNMNTHVESIEKKLKNQIFKRPQAIPAADQYDCDAGTNCFLYVDELSSA
jgi:hypothetical protein